jgi:WD40 repeat protein
VVKLAWLPGSPLLAVATSHGMVRVFDGRDGSVHASFTGHIGIVLDFWTNGKELVSTGDDGVARVYALA